MVSADLSCFFVLWAILWILVISQKNFLVLCQILRFCFKIGVNFAAEI